VLQVPEPARKVSLGLGLSNLFPIPGWELSAMRSVQLGDVHLVRSWAIALVAAPHGSSEASLRNSSTVRTRANSHRSEAFDHPGDQR
jgi:hypothetical protein